MNCHSLRVCVSVMANGGSGSLESREVFAACIKDCGGDAETLQAMFIDTQGSEGDKKSILEQAFRDVVKEWIKNPKGNDLSQFTDLVLLAISSAQIGICYHTVPFILLSDVLDCVTLDVCENVFKFLEDQVRTYIVCSILFHSCL